MKTRHFILKPSTTECALSPFSFQQTTTTTTLCRHIFNNNYYNLTKQNCFSFFLFFFTMELALSLGDTSKSFTFLDKAAVNLPTNKDPPGLFSLAPSFAATAAAADKRSDAAERRGFSSDPPVQLDLLPFSPVLRPQQHPPSHLRIPWLTQACK